MASGGVLHIVESLHRGSVERWLLRLWRHARDTGRPFNWTFYCILPEPGVLDAQATEDGLDVFRSPVPLARKTAFLRALRRHVRERRYSIIHSHHDLLSAFYWTGLVGLPPARVTHIHDTADAIPTASPWKRALLLEAMRSASLQMSDLVLATSAHALDHFLGMRRRDPRRHRVHYCSLDPEPYLLPAAVRATARRALGVGDTTEVLLFAGTMMDLKNPAFVVDVMKHLVLARPNVVAVFAGAGPDEEGVRRAATNAGLESRVRVLGWREDMPALMRAADLFINPRREWPPEAFGLVVLEAQAAGTRLLVSDGISTEPILQGSISRQVPLSAGPAAWANEACRVLDTPRPSDADVRRMFAGSPFDPDRAVDDLHAMYRQLRATQPDC